MIQQALFDAGIRPPPAEEPRAPFVADSETSRQAALAIGPRLSALQAKVLRFITNRGDYGATDEEVALSLNMRGDTARARRCELRDASLVVKSDKRRPTTSGQSAAVWIAVDESSQEAF